MRAVGAYGLKIQSEFLKQYTYFVLVQAFELDRIKYTVPIIPGFRGALSRNDNAKISKYLEKYF
jgi:hypothetical protein